MLASCAVLVLVSAAVAGGAELTLLHTLGGEGDDNPIHRPCAVVFARDGSAYVCNDGDCRILRFDRDWNLVGAFGRRGGGPGEFEQPNGLLLHRDRIWIFEPARVTVFDRSGRHERTVPLRTMLAAPVARGDEILCRLGAGERAIAAVDDSLRIRATLGPRCARDLGFARSRSCGFLQILGHPDHRCLVIDPLTGTLYAVGADGEVASEIELVERSGDAHRSADGRIAEFNMVLGQGFVDRDARLWILHESSKDDPFQVIEVLDREFRRIAAFRLPDRVNGFVLAESPDGNLVVLDYPGSQVHVLARPVLEPVGHD